jgi:hypothetical protein
MAGLDPAIHAFENLHMPDRAFLEEYSLYSKNSFSVPSTLDRVPQPSIKMSCAVCGTDQTFTMNNEYFETYGYNNVESSGQIVRARYLCMGCKKHYRYFFILIDEDCKSITKVGQYPSWDISGNEEIERLLGEHKNYFRRGLICESQGYGIAAFAYYRRIVEEIIDLLLEQISDLMTNNEKVKYDEALKKTKTTRQATEKIDLIKDLLPPILRPDGMNPVKLLHESLSEGLHADTDNNCLQRAAEVRSVLAFLTAQIASTKRTANAFTAGMRTLLDKKKQTK